MYKKGILKESTIIKDIIMSISPHTRDMLLNEVYIPACNFVKVNATIADTINYMMISCAFIDKINTMKEKYADSIEDISIVSIHHTEDMQRYLSIMNHKKNHIYNIIYDDTLMHYSDDCYKVNLFRLFMNYVNGIHIEFKNGRQVLANINYHSLFSKIACPDNEHLYMLYGGRLKESNLSWISYDTSIKTFANNPIYRFFMNDSIKGHLFNNQHTVLSSLPKIIDGNLTQKGIQSYILYMALIHHLNLTDDKFTIVAFDKKHMILSCIYDDKPMQRELFIDIQLAQNTRPYLFFKSYIPHKIMYSENELKESYNKEYIYMITSKIVEPIIQIGYKNLLCIYNTYAKKVIDCIAPYVTKIPNIPFNSINDIQKTISSYMITDSASLSITKLTENGTYKGRKRRDNNMDNEREH